MCHFFIRLSSKYRQRLRVVVFFSVFVLVASNNVCVCHSVALLVVSNDFFFVLFFYSNIRDLICKGIAQCKSVGESSYSKRRRIGLQLSTPLSTIIMSVIHFSAYNQMIDDIPATQPNKIEVLLNVTSLNSNFFFF